MTFQNEFDTPSTAAILTPEVQQAVWFLGALIRVRAGGDATDGRLAILEHQREHGYNSPVHRHDADEETFYVLDGELRVEVRRPGACRGNGSGRGSAASTAALLRGDQPAGPFPHPAHAGGFDRFTLAAGTPATATDTMPTDEVPPDPAALAAMASSYGIEILGPPPTP